MALTNVEKLLSRAVAHFWATRRSQHDKQLLAGKLDAGNRGAATGGKHADGFINVLAHICNSAGLPDVEIFTQEKRERTLPGFFRPTKEWDIVVRSKSDLIAVVEVKSQVGSFGNNFNNRVEEALGNATDFRAAYREGVFKPSCPPWLGYLFMLEEESSSLRPKRQIQLAPYPILDEFQEKSYAQLYELCCLRLVRERLYDAACFFTSNKADGLNGMYREPNPELSIMNFAVSLHSRVAAFAEKQ